MQTQYEYIDDYLINRQLPMSSNSMMMNINASGGPNPGMMGPRPVLPPKPIMSGARPLPTPNQNTDTSAPALPPKPRMMAQSSLSQSNTVLSQPAGGVDPFATNPQQRAFYQQLFIQLVCFICLLKY